jgi:hypothetical protein
MTRRDRKRLSPELWAKYQAWLRKQPTDNTIRYFRDGEFDTFKLNEAEQGSFDQWIKETERAGEVDFETEDEEEDHLTWADKHPVLIGRYDLITRYLLEQHIVATKREAWLIQAAVIVFLVTVYVFWPLVFA